MRLLVAVLLAAASSAPVAARALDVEWAMQDRSRAQIALRAVAATPGSSNEAPLPAGWGAGGEVGVGGRLAGMLLAEVRVGYVRSFPRGDFGRDPYMGDLWFGLAVGGWLSPRATVSPTFGLSLVYHDMTFDGADQDGLGLHVDLGIAFRIHRRLLLTAGARGGLLFPTGGPERRLEPVLSIEILI